MLAQEILLRAKKNVWTHLSSENLSKIHGNGLDFAKIRPYQAGDDVRFINFTASAKTDELQTNVFYENKQISVVIAVFLTSSLYFGSKVLKTETIAEILAILALSSLKQHNKTKVILSSKTLDEFNIQDEAQVFEIIEKILNFNFKNNSLDFDIVKNFLLNYNKSLMFVLGDFYQQYNLDSVAHKHQLNNIIIRDKLEENPNFISNMDLVDRENNQLISIDFNKNVAKKYQNEISKIDNKNYNYFVQNNITFGKIFTDDNYFLRLNNILNG